MLMWWWTWTDSTSVQNPFVLASTNCRKNVLRWKIFALILSWCFCFLNFCLSPKTKALFIPLFVMLLTSETLIDVSYMTESLSLFIQHREMFSCRLSLLSSRNVKCSNTTLKPELCKTKQSKTKLWGSHINDCINCMKISLIIKPLVNS